MAKSQKQKWSEFNLMQRVNCVQSLASKVLRVYRLHTNEVFNVLLTGGVVNWEFSKTYPNEKFKFISEKPYKGENMKGFKHVIVPKKQKVKYDHLVIKFEKAQLKVPKGYVEYIQRPEVYDFDVLEDFGINRKDVGEYLGVGKVHKKKKLIICK